LGDRNFLSHAHSLIDQSLLTMATYDRRHESAARPLTRRGGRYRRLCRGASQNRLNARGMPHEMSARDSRALTRRRSEGKYNHAQLFESHRYHGHGFADHRHRSGYLLQLLLRTMQLLLLQLLLLLIGP